MAIEGIITEDGLPYGKVLALEEGSRSKNAYCLSSYGAFMAVCQLSPSGIREVFCNTHPGELLELAEAVEENMCEYRGAPEKHEGELKDLAFKREILLSMAADNRDKDFVSPDDKGHFNSSSSDN